MIRSQRGTKGPQRLACNHFGENHDKLITLPSERIRKLLEGFKGPHRAMTGSLLDYDKPSVGVLSEIVRVN